MATVQVVIYVSSLAIFGPAPVSRSSKEHSDQIGMPNLIVENVFRHEPGVLLVGNRDADLIRLGARYSPCMRHDPDLYRSIVEKQNELDRSSGCCVSNEGAGCYQTQREHCVSLLSTWFHYDNHSGAASFATTTTKRKTGPVCGLDPANCLVSHGNDDVFDWSTDDVTKWPICVTMKTVSNKHASRPAPHIDCEVTARPCCLYNRGQCVMTTEEHCAFMQGIYNPEASLCSQVNCLEKICGLWGFSGKQPDQLQRLFYSLFIHSNLFQLFISILIEVKWMSNFEQLMGSCYIIALYFTSNINGALLSSILLPYQIETGPTLMGILCVMLLDFHRHKEEAEDIRAGYILLLVPSVLLFLFGLLPLIDNFANLGALLSGLTGYGIEMITHTAKDFGAFGSEDTSKRMAILKYMWTTVLAFLPGLPLFIILIVIFLAAPVIHYPPITYMTCAAGQNLCAQFQQTIHENGSLGSGVAVGVRCGQSGWYGDCFNLNPHSPLVV